MFLLGLIALTMLIPLLLGLAYGEGVMVKTFLVCMGTTLIIALPVIFVTRKQKITLSAGDGLVLVFVAWVFTCLVGAVPYYISGYILRFSDAVFESVSGFTTTGASVIIDVEALPRSLLFWRAMTHWLGGMGIVVLTVALFPLLGIEGFLLVKAETSGPESNKILPKITSTAKILWLIYTLLTVLQSLLLCLGGMNWFDAVIHAFSTVATGGFSSRNGGLATYPSPWIHWVCIIFMILAGFNFTLFYRLLQGKYRDMLSNTEAKVYGGIILVSTGLIILSMFSSDNSLGGSSFEQSLRYALFQGVSIVTSTGLSITDHSRWPPLAQGVLFCLMFIGACSGSTSGGIKVIRHVVLFKQMVNELRRLIYPQGVFLITFNHKAGPHEVAHGVAGFVFCYMVLVLLTTLWVSSSGMDLFPALNMSLMILGNIGLSIGDESGATSLYGLPAYIKWFLSFMMITGRLELWTVLGCFSRDYRHDWTGRRGSRFYKPSG
jgi:trk system potassium uptake protein TrkH